MTMTMTMTNTVVTPSDGQRMTHKGWREKVKLLRAGCSLSCCDSMIFWTGSRPIRSCLEYDQYRERHHFGQYPMSFSDLKAVLKSSYYQ
jgi:hypothetical protein